MIVYYCDNCDKEFGGPLDRENGYDLCAPCRKELEDGKKAVEDEFFGKIKTKKEKK